MMAPAAPTPSASVPAGVPVPGNIPMSSESRAASIPLNMEGAGGASSIPIPTAEEYEKDIYPAEEYGADSIPTASMPSAEELSNENAENSDIPELSEYGESAAQSLRAEPPSSSMPFQPDFAARESAAPEIAAASAPGTMIDFSAPIQPIQPLQPDQAASSAEGSEKPVKYYTFGHIALCLAAVGVMAVVAGIFAGLYFSVI